MTERMDGKVAIITGAATGIGRVIACRLRAKAARPGLLASGGMDGTVRLWEASTGAHLHTLRSDRRYETVDVTGLTGVTAAQRVPLLALGTIEPGQATAVKNGVR